MIETLLLLVIAGLILMQLWPYLQGWRLRGRRIPGATGTAAGRLLFFWHPECGQCLGMKPLMDKLQREQPGIVMIDVSEQPALASRYGISGTPTLVLEKDQRILDVQFGPRSEAGILELLAVLQEQAGPQQDRTSATD